MADGHLHAEAASSSDSDDARHGDHASAAWSEWCADEEMGSAADEQPAQSLFSPAMLPDAAAAVAHDTSEHGFDLLRYASEVAPGTCLSAVMRGVPTVDAAKHGATDPCVQL
jgi:hypothetical protein